MPSRFSPRPMTNLITTNLITTNLITTLALSTTPALAGDNPGAHQHGQALLQVAAEGQAMDVMLSSPAFNLLGFEYSPRSEAEHSRQDQVRDWLSSTPLLRLTEGNCQVTAGQIDLHDDGSTEKHEHEAEHADEHEHEPHGDEHQATTTHRDVEVSQTIRCDRPIAGQEIGSPLLEQFTNLEELRVEWLSEHGQGSSELSQDNPLLRLVP